MSSSAGQGGPEGVPGWAGVPTPPEQPPPPLPLATAQYGYYPPVSELAAAPPRPGVLNLGVALLLLSGLPWLVSSVIGLFTIRYDPPTGSSVANNPVGGLLLSIAFVAFAIRTRGGRNSARVTVTVLTALFGLGAVPIVVIGLGAGLASEPGGPFVIGLVCVTMGLAIAGLILVYRKPVSAYIVQAAGYRAYLASIYSARRQQQPPPG